MIKKRLLAILLLGMVFLCARTKTEKKRRRKIWNFRG